MRYSSLEQLAQQMGNTRDEGEVEVGPRSTICEGRVLLRSKTQDRKLEEASFPLVLYPTPPQGWDVGILAELGDFPSHTCFRTNN